MKHPDKPFGVVAWDDAWASGEEVPEDELVHGPMRFQIYGWIVRSDEKGVTIASEWRPHDGKWRDRSFIPRGMVVEELVLSLSKKAKKRDRSRLDPAGVVRSTGVPVQAPNDQPSQ